MKYIIIMLMFFVNVAQAAESCSENVNVDTKDVVYAVNTDMPKHLKGATITVTLANGKTSTVSADKFMVVPRKQQTVVGQDKISTKTISCTNNLDTKKNIVFVDAKKEYTGIETSTSVNGNTQQVTVSSKKELVPGLNYYRRQILDSKIGAGVGIDTNGQLKGMVGLDF